MSQEPSLATLDAPFEAWVKLIAHIGKEIPAGSTLEALVYDVDEAFQREAESVRSETPQKPSFQQIVQAVARGWCHSENSSKEMDAYLAAAISREVQALFTLSAIPRSEPDEDGERYRWFRNECAWFRRADIVEVAGEDAAMLDHYIDKGRCGL